MYTHIPKKSSSLIFHSIIKIAGLLSCAIFAFLSTCSNINNTKAFFLNETNLEKNSVKAGHWIPTLTIAEDSQKADGQNGWHKTTPCIKFEATIENSEDESTIFYVLNEIKENNDHKHIKKNDDNKEFDVVVTGEKYDGKCVQIPAGKWNLTAQAVNMRNVHWRSDIIKADYSVDTERPFIKPAFPKNDQNLHGKIALSFDLTDDFLKGYHLTIKNSHDDTVFEKEAELQNKEAHYKHDWDTRTNKDGDYKIIFNAFDNAGNESILQWKLNINNKDTSDDSKVSSDGLNGQETDLTDKQQAPIEIAPETPPQSAETNSASKAAVVDTSVSTGSSLDSSLGSSSSIENLP